MEYEDDIISVIEDNIEDKQDVLSIFRELSDATVDESFHMTLEKKIETECREEQRCSECFEIMTAKTHQESRGYYGMEPAYEEVHELICPHCGHRE